MPNQQPLFRCRYLPLFWMLIFAVIALILTLLKFTQAEFTNLLSLENWLFVLTSQPIHGWMTTAVVGICLMFVASMQLVVYQEDICIEAWSITFSQLAERQKIQKLQLYNHARSKNWRFKSLLPNKARSLEDEWKISTVGFILKPAYRMTHTLKRLWLGQLAHADRIQLIHVLTRHWDLNPHSILAMDQLSHLVRRHKLR